MTESVSAEVSAIMDMFEGDENQGTLDELDDGFGDDFDDSVMQVL